MQHTLSPAANALTNTHESDLGAAGQADAIIRTLALWHDTEHPGAYSTCMVDPCYSIGRIS